MHPYRLAGAQYTSRIGFRAGRQCADYKCGQDGKNDAGEEPNCPQRDRLCTLVRFSLEPKNISLAQKPTNPIVLSAATR